MSALVSTIDDMVAELNERGEHWDIHQTHDRRWVVTIGSHLDPRYRTVNEPTIALALAAALASKALPVVPPRPLVPTRSQFTIRKEGSYWRIHHSGSSSSKSSSGSSSRSSSSGSGTRSSSSGSSRSSSGRSSGS